MGGGMPRCRRCGGTWARATRLDPEEPCDCYEGDGRDDVPEPEDREPTEDELEERRAWVRGLRGES